jgi:hypothetical protein
MRAKPNGLGIALMVSGGWKSGRPSDTPVLLMAPLLRRGYTIFAVRPISQPDANVMEIIDDANLRHHAKDYGIDPTASALPAAASADSSA